MSFRNDGKKSTTWRRWKTVHQENLLRCGLPDFILQTERDWILFLQEGYDATGWNPSMLRQDQQQALYDLIQQEYGNVSHYGVLHDLKILLGIAPPSLSDSP